MKRNYRKVIGWLLALILALPLTVATVAGQTTQQQPSAKVTAKTSQFTLIPPTTGTGGWVTILSNNIKTAEMKDLFVTAALEAGVYTQTAVTGTGTSTARGKLRSEEHTSELQSLTNLVCRLLLEKKKKAQT